MGKHKIARTPGWWIVRAVFGDPDKARVFAEEVKALPFDDRRWCRKIQAWAIRRTHTTFVVDLAGRYLGIKIKA